MNKHKIILFTDKKDCCNCSACENICPKDAIFTYEDEYGFKYPKIDHEKCIACSLCKKVCAFQTKEETNVPLDTFVAVNKDEKILLKSASGGAFVALAKLYLENNGVVYGATLDSDLTPIHIGINSIQDLPKLQGSKYVQSDLGNTFKEIKQLLNKGKDVLFSGVPCQVAGLKGYLMKDYNNLLTVDIICHGVPNASFFKDYLSFTENQLNGKIKEFKFRDKNISWEKNGSLLYEKNGKEKRKKIYASESSFYYYFSNSDIFRENCYSCKYTCENRPGDITLGDYWGIETVHPELLGNGKIQEEKGVSVVVANSEKGKIVIENCDEFHKFISDFSKARAKNDQLNEPSKKGKSYDKVMNAYKNQGYEGVHNLYSKEIGIKRYKSRVKALLPLEIKRIIKRNM